ncbi:sodium/potassium-transporting ATPase subunit alpha [Pseudoscourfieldia marina]
MSDGEMKKTGSFGDMMKSNKKKEEERQAALRKDIDFVEHTYTLDQIEKEMNTSLEKGMTSAAVQASREKHGWNRLTPPPQTPEWIKFLLQFTNFFAMLLLGGGILCFIGYGIDSSDSVNLYLGIVLCTVVFITSTFSYLQERKSAKIMEGFKSLIPKKCNVIRDGGIVKIDALELVPGDVVEFTDGDQVPADIRVVKCNDLKVDNSSLTGESEPQERVTGLAKDSDGNEITTVLEATNLLFYTTIINSGNGKGVVIGTGDHTVMGQIAGLTLETGAEETPIAKEIHAFILLISAVAMILGITFFAVSLALGTDPIKCVVFAIGIIVANVPEGLLATVTVSLALTAQRMHLKNVLVKNLEAVETLGSTTVIASDKTGTLTQNRMTVQHTWYNGEVKRVPAARNSAEYTNFMSNGEIDGEKLWEPTDATFEKLRMVATLCNNAAFLTNVVDEDGNEKTLDIKKEMGSATFNMLGLDCSGDASESGLIKAMQPIEDVLDVRTANPKVFEIKFNSTNKWQLSIHETGMGNTLVLKGAPERVLGMCSKILINGREEPMTEEWQEKYNKAYEGLGGLGERVLGFAMKNMEEEKGFKYQQKPERNFKMDDLTFVGLFSLIDPPRDGVPEAVAKCKRAGVKVFMVTGDHPITAEAIAESVGIIDKEVLEAGNATVIKGDDIRDVLELPKDEQIKQWDKWLSHKQIVFARVSPAHKLLIVENNQRRGEVVAVTGDGVNDAPALKKGDIGCAMGIAGKDVSKEAADMILMDDNFASIVNGIEEGRIIFDNLKKSISYTLTSNIPEIGPFLAFIIIQIPLPLSTILILCVDLGTDMVPAISLAYELKEADIMNRPPRTTADRLVNRKLITFAYLQIGIIQVLAGFYTYLVVLNDFGYPPWVLPWVGLDWDDYSLMCKPRGDGAPSTCGYGCDNPKAASYDAQIGKNRTSEMEYCKGGCKIPDFGAVDPFVEFGTEGFRGFTFGTEAACGRSCKWFEALKPDIKNLTVSAEENAMFTKYCAVNKDYGFEGRSKIADAKRADAPHGSYYWWNGEAQLYPNVRFQESALKYAQTSYFIGIIVVQWADLIISKTRKLSVFDQGMSNKFMNFGLAFETILGALLIYVPFLNDAFFTRPLHILHCFTCVPFSILIFTYDEVRKSIIRQYPGGWLEAHTYW